MNRCLLCGYGTTGEWWDEGICEDCHRHRNRAFLEWEALNTDIPDHATDTYLTQRPGASRGPRAPKNLSKGTHHDA